MQKNLMSAVSGNLIVISTENFGRGLGNWPLLQWLNGHSYVS